MAAITPLNQLFTPAHAPANPLRTMVSNVQSGHGWTTSNSPNTTLNDTTDFAIGTQSIKFTTNGAGAQLSLDKASLTLDLTNKYVDLWVKVDDVTHLSALRFLAASTAFTAYYQTTLYAQGGATSNIQSGRWQCIRFSLDGAAVTGSPNQASIVTIRVAALDDSAGTATVHIGGVATVPRATASYPNGVVSFTCDDGYITQYTAMRPALDKWGYAATAYPIQSLIGSSGSFMTLQNLKDLEANSGWEIGAHATSSATHDPVGAFTLLSDSQVDAEFRAMRKWLISNGFKGSDQMAWPQGAYNATCLARARQYFQSGRGLANTTYKEALPPSPGEAAFTLRATGLGATPTLATVEGLVDTAYTWGTWLIILVHKLTASPSGSLEWSSTDFPTLVDYINTKGIPVRTVGDVLRSL